jgi:hypothetical protein
MENATLYYKTNDFTVKKYKFYMLSLAPKVKSGVGKWWHKDLT